MSGAAAATDYFAPSPFGPYSWIGPYIGATAGYEWGWVSNSPAQLSGLSGGIEGGYNWQHGHFVFGGEADFNISSASAIAPVDFANPWFGTVRGRGGVTIGPNVLVFGTAGLAFGDLRADTGGVSESHGNLGWVAGGGVEVGFAQRWSAKAEWLYIDLAGSNFSITGANNGLTANLLRFGVNYRF